MKIEGGCHCGALAFEADANPNNVTLCHCTDCQSLSGSAFRTVLPVRAEKFKMVRGEPRIYVKRGESGAERPQAFCAECGTQIYGTGVGDAAAVIGIRVGTTKQRSELAPKRQIWCQSAMPWLTDLPIEESKPKG